MSYRSVDRLRAGPGWNLSSILISYQNKLVRLVHLVGFIIKKFPTMQHGHVNVKFKKKEISKYSEYYKVPRVIKNIVKLADFD